jgi:hypothetical protein
VRLWTIHPKYLDAKGLVALWREGLLAQKVLRGKTKGYRHHPQLARFREHPNPVAAIATYLNEIKIEAKQRGYKFDNSKIYPRRSRRKLSETSGQLLYEWNHLREKLQRRDAKRFNAYLKISKPDPHPLFKAVPGGIREWERGQATRL